VTAFSMLKLKYRKERSEWQEKSNLHPLNRKMSAFNTETPLITDVQSYNYIEDDGTYVSEVTFNENGIFSSIIKAVRQDGSYTVTVDQGDYHDVLQGVYEGVFTYALHWGHHYFHEIQGTKAKVGDKRSCIVCYPCVDSNRTVTDAFSPRVYETALMDNRSMPGSCDNFSSRKSNAPQR
jgi:hypothetical protein